MFSLTSTLATLLASALAQGSAVAPAAMVETGRLGSAPFRIDRPAVWNGELVVYLHGYRKDPVAHDQGVGPDAAAAGLTIAGFAVAASGFSSGGYAIREAVADAEALRRRFVRRHGSPRATWVVGQSLGGSITVMLMELHPTTYDGGLAMCAPLGPASSYIKATAFDPLVVFEFLFPGVLPSPAAVPRTFLPTVEREASIERMLDEKPEGAATLRRIMPVRTNRELAQNLDLFTYVVGELAWRWGGNPFDNTDTVYVAGAAGLRVNDGVRRYRADPRAQAMLIRDYTPTGNLRRPLLSVRNAYDPLIGAYTSDGYPSGALYAQRYTASEGHCSFTQHEVRAALEALRRWRKTGLKPPSGADFRR
jgi:pimeloyl-ACP methyl ester carboxylesterase